MIPRTLADFREYLAAQLAGPEILVTAPARDVAALELSARPLRLAAMALLRAAERVAPSPSLELPVRSLAA